MSGRAKGKKDKQLHKDEPIRTSDTIDYSNSKVAASSKSKTSKKVSASAVNQS